MFGGNAEPSRPVLAVPTALSPPSSGCTVSLQTVVPIVMAVGLCAMYIRCRSLSPLDRPIQGLLYPGYRFSGRYVLAGSSGQVRANHGSDRMAGPPRGKTPADRDNAGPHESPARQANVLPGEPLTSR